MDEHVGASGKAVRDVGLEEQVLNGFDTLQELLGSLGKGYQKLRFSGTLVVVGAAIILFTMLVAFQTDASGSGALFLNVDRGEQILFTIVGVVLIAIGGSFLGLRNHYKHRLDMLKYDTEVRRVEFDQERLLAGMRARLSNPEPRRGEYGDIDG